MGNFLKGVGVSDLNRQQVDAAERVRGLVDADARVVSMEIGSGFGRLQTLAHVAGMTFSDRHALLVVGRTWLLDRAIEAISERAPGRRVGLLGTGADVEVVTLRRALDAARGNRIRQDLVVVDGTEPEQAADLAEFLALCPEAAFVLHVEPTSDAPVADPDSFSFPVAAVEWRAPALDDDPEASHRAFRP